MKHAIFLDRDGVIIRALSRDGKPYPPSSVEEVEFLPAVRDCFEMPKRQGFTLIVVTNQPDVARGVQRQDVVERINRLIAEALPIDDIFVCYYDDRDACECRKPKPGMLLQASAKHKLDLKSYMIGHRWRNIEAGRSAGCRTVLIEYGYNETLKSQLVRKSVFA